MAQFDDKRLPLMRWYSGKNSGVSVSNISKPTTSISFRMGSGLPSTGTTPINHEAAFSLQAFRRVGNGRIEAPAEMTGLRVDFFDPSGGLVGSTVLVLLDGCAMGSLPKGGTGILLWRARGKDGAMERGILVP